MDTSYSDDKQILKTITFESNKHTHTEMKLAAASAFWPDQLVSAN